MSDVPKMTDNFLDDFPDKCETELSNSMTCNFDSENLCGWRGENVQFRDPRTARHQVGRVRVGARLFFIGAPTRTDRCGDPWFSSDEAKHLLQIPDQTKPTRRTIIFISNPPTQTKQKYFHQRYLNTLKYVSNSIIICME